MERRERYPGRKCSAALVAVITAMTVLAAGSVSAGRPKTKNPARFAADMAERGNWREAKYRWEIVRREQPDNPRILNNLAVAAEILGEVEEAKLLYEQAVETSGGNTHILDNQRRFAWSLKQRSAPGDDEDTEEYVPPEPEGGAARGNKGRKEGKPFRVTVGVPIPPRLSLDGVSSVLVTSFRAQDSNLLDINRELVRFIRTELSKRTELDVLDVVPPPAIPEQRIPDLLANSQFWKYLSREHGADLIISGVVIYSREDVSGFEDVDYVSPRTGQKIRQTKFVEREQFDYELEVFFMDGPTGAMLYRDRLSRSLVFRGQMNDPITAFYELNESIASDVLAVVTTRRRQESRFVFRR
jgi:hypothetical protein